MVAKKLDTTLVGLAGALAMGALAVGCSAPPAPASTGGPQSEALQDSAYNALINDPSTGRRDWASTSPMESGIAYWHVGWVSKRGTGGRAVEYVLATGYDRLTQRESVEVVIPQTANDVAYEFRSLGGAPLDETRLAADVDAISAGLADVLSSASSEQGSQCAGRRGSYRRPSRVGTLRRCRVRGSAYDSATAEGTGATPSPQKAADPIVVFLNIALDIAQTVQDQAHCDADVGALADDYRGSPTNADEWGDDCESGGYRDDPEHGSSSDGTGRTAGSSCPEIGKVCFSSDGAKRGTCGADYKCWQ